MIMMNLCGGKCGGRAILNTNVFESLPLRQCFLTYHKFPSQIYPRHHNPYIFQEHINTGNINYHQLSSGLKVF